MSFRIPVQRTFQEVLHWRASTRFLGLALAALFFPCVLFAQCPSNPALTPTTWGGASGNENYAGGVYTLSANGTYSNNQNFEQGEAAFRRIAGDGQIQAEVVSESGYSGTDTSAGLFIRDGSNSGANGAMIWVERPSNPRYTYADRSGGGSIQEHQSGTAAISYWLRLQNSNGMITPGISLDGVSWTPLQTYDLSSDLGGGTNLYWGLMVWSGNSSQATTVLFDNVCLSGVTPMPTVSRTPTPSFTPTFTLTSTPTSTATGSPTPTPTPTRTFTQVPTPSTTPTWTPTITPSPPPGVKVWPNPVVPGSPPNDKAHFQLPANHGAGHLVIADLKRHRVRSLDFGAGTDVQWDAKDDSGAAVPSGVYLYLLEMDGSVHRGTITVMR